MLFPKSIVLDTLKDYNGTPHFGEQDNRSYTSAALLPDDPGEMRRDLLYVCGLSEALKRNEVHQGCHYVCIRDCFWSESEEDELMSGIIINENRSINWLFNLLQRRFMQIEEWVQNMQLALLEGGGYQQLLDLCEPVLGNSVHLLDASFSLLAYTSNLEKAEPFTLSLIEHGYHTDETMKRFERSHRFSVYDKEDGPIISEPGIISQYEVVSQWCRYDGIPLVHTVMLCDHTPRSNALIDLFSLLMKYVSMYTNAQQKKLESQPQRYTSLFMDLLYGTLDRADVISERAKITNVDFAGNFDVYRIRFNDNSIILIRRVMSVLADALPEAKMVSKDYEITILNAYASTDVRQNSALNIKRIYPVLEKYDAVCGVSSDFTHLTGLKNAAAQASMACEIGQKIYHLDNYWNFEPGLWKNIAGDRDARVFRFDDDAYIHYVFSATQSISFDMCRNTFYSNALVTLMNYDSEHGGNLVQILYTYLICDRSPSAAGKLLNMHRNNVVYHISRIEELLRINLDDHKVRLKIMLSFYFFELKAANERKLEG